MITKQRNNPSLYAGKGRRLSPSEQAEKTRDWPKSNGKSMEQSNREAQQEAMQYSNLPPGINSADLD